MAKLYGEIAAKSLLTLDKSFARANGQPLDASEVYYSLDAARTYAAGAQAYIGQKIVVIENDVITHYSIEDTEGTLKELGSKPIGDGDTITVSEDGTISLASIPDDADTKTYNAVLVNGKLVWQTPSETTVEGLDTRLLALESEVGDPATDTTEATGLYLAIANGIQEAKDYADANDDNTTYELVYDEENHIIRLMNGMIEISSISAMPFIKDGMLNDVEYNADNNTLIFTWNTDSGEKTDTVVLSDIIEPYTKGSGIDITDNRISVKVDSDSDQYLSISENGIKVKGIDTAISQSISDNNIVISNKYATKEELKETDDIADSNAAAITNLTSRLDGIVAQGGEPNVINNIKVNGVTQTIADDKSVDITVPTKVSELTDDTDFDERIIAAQNDATNAGSAASMAQTTANEAKASIEANATTIGEHTTQISGLTTTTSEHTTKIIALENADTAHAAEYSALSEIVSGHTSTIATKADTTTVNELTTKVTANETAIKTINETTIPAINTEIAKKANSENVYTKTEIGTIADGKTLVGMISDAKTEATYNDNEVRSLITDNSNAIKAIYDNSGESATGILVNEITRIEGLVSAEESRAKGVESDHEIRIADMETFWAAADDPEGTIDKLAEIVSYIESDKSGALDMAADIQANTEAIEAIYVAADSENPASGVLADVIADVNINSETIAAIRNEDTGILATAKKYTDDSISAIPVATAEKLGFVKFDNTTIKMNESNQLYVNQVNVNQLVQTAGEELTLNGGTAV